MKLRLKDHICTFARWSNLLNRQQVDLKFKLLCR